jgi:hypothetical protein
MNLIDPGFNMVYWLQNLLGYFAELFLAMLGISLAAMFLRIMVAWGGRAIKAH